MSLINELNFVGHFSLPFTFIILIKSLCFHSGSDGEESAYNADLSSNPGSIRSPETENSKLLQYSAWRIPWTEAPGRLQSMGSQRVDSLN